MIDNIETYCCESRDCGRKFQKLDQLLDHYKRRHNELFLKCKENIDYDDIKTNQSEFSGIKLKNKNILNNLFEKIDSLEKEANSTFMFQKEDFDKNNLELGENLQLHDLDYDQDENIFNEENFIESEQNLEKSEKIIDDIKNYENIENFQNLQKFKNVNDIYLEEKSANQSIMNATTSSIAIDRVTVITDELLGIGTEYADYDEINEMNLEEKNLAVFKTKKNVNFNYLLYVTSLNLSKNFLKDITDVCFLNTIRILNISNNRIDDISALENLEYLEILQAENNEITSIGNLNRCKSLRVLELADNKIKYESSTYKTLKNLDKVRELTIKNNPFLEEVFGYKHLFIQKYPKITKLDREEITDLDRDFAVKFLNENSVLNKEIVRPYSSKIEATRSKINEIQGQNENFSQESLDSKLLSTKNTDDNLPQNIQILSTNKIISGNNHTTNLEQPIQSKISKNITPSTNMNKTLANIKDKVISQIEYVGKPNSNGSSLNTTRTTQQKSSHPLKNINKPLLSNRMKPGTKPIPPVESEFVVLKKELEEIRLENKCLAEKNKSHELEINTLKSEVESLMQLNKEYEKIIEENKRTKSLLSDKNKQDEEKKKLKSEVDSWKREYFDLLDKSMSTNVNSSRLLLNDEKFVRPQTAKLNYPMTNSRIEIGAEFNLGFQNISSNILEKTLGSFSNSNIKNESTQMSVTKRKNSLDESLNSDTDNAGKIENFELEKSKSEKSESNSQLGDDEEDDEIDELLRKSMTNLNVLKKEIKVLSKASIIDIPQDSNPNKNSFLNRTKNENKSRSVSKPKISPKNSSTNNIVKNKVFNNINKK